MIMNYLMKFYDYIISLISSSPSRPTIKHKNSEDISEDDIKEIIPNNCYTSQNETATGSKIPIPVSRSKKHVHFEQYPNYQCGYCGKTVQIAQYLYQDTIFCSIMCRTRHISAVQTTTQNAYV